MATSIAIIIPTLNEERSLPQTLSYLRQLQANEIILVDGGSNDKTLEIAQSQINCISQRNAKILTATCGRALQMNTGAEEAQSDILLFLHADTKLPPNARTEIEDIMESFKYVGGRFDIQFEEDRGWAWVISRMINLRSRWSGIATGDQAIFVRREIFHQMGGYANIPLMEDVEFMQRLRNIGQVASLQTKVITSFRRWEHQGAIRTILHMWLIRFLYWAGVKPKILHKFYAAIR